MMRFSESRDSWQLQQIGLRLKLALVAALLVAVAVHAGACAVIPGVPTGDTSPSAAAGVSPLAYPVSLVHEMEQPLGDQWLLPAAVTVAAGNTFVLDTGNNRILQLAPDNRVLAVFDVDSGHGPVLQQPMAMASNGSRLFVANSLTAEVLVLDLAGRVQRVLALEPVTAGDRTPRPIGVAVTPDGSMVVSDADNHRVLRLDAGGNVLWSAGTGTRAEGSEGFNVPGALAVDRTGNVYVVDTLNGRVVKLSPDGAFVAQFGRLGNTAGTLSRPKGVAVDSEGRVFVSDGLLTAIQVFAADGTYLGFIGRRDPADPASGSLFRAPAGLSLVRDTLYVMDRFLGLITLELHGLPPPEVEGEGS